MAELSASTQRSNGKIRSHKVSTRIDMTPMVDLAFLLLTFFILTTNLLKQRAMDVIMPDKKDEITQPVNARRVLTLLLDEHNKIYWFVCDKPVAEETSWSKTGVRKVLLAKNAAIHNMIILVKATDKSTYKNLVDIMDEFNITAMQRYSFADMTRSDDAILAVAKRKM